MQRIVKAPGRNRRPRPDESLARTKRRKASATATKDKQMITLSAPYQSGYKQDFETNEQMLLAAATLLRVSVDEMVCVQCYGQDDRFYYYADQDQADSDPEGSYAVQSTGAALLQFVFTAGRHEDTGSFDTYAQAEDRATYLAESWRDHVTATERHDRNSSWVAEYAAAVQA